MKIRIQGYDGFICEREVTERGARSVRVPDIDGHTETFSIVTGDILYSVRSLRVHLDDVPALKSLPLRVAKTKPLDLNAHPLAPVLRGALTKADNVAAAFIRPGEPIDDAVGCARATTGNRRENCVNAVAFLLAAITMLDKPEPPCP